MVEPPSTAPSANALLRTFGEGLFALLGAIALAASVNLHRTTMPEYLEVLGQGVLCLSCIALTRFHLRHTPLGGVKPVAAGRILLLVSLAGIVGVQILHHALNTQVLMGKAFLLTAPLLAEAMLISALLGPAISMFALTITCMLIGVGGAAPLELLLVSWLGGAVGAHAVNPMKSRSHLLRSMSITGLAMGIIACGATAMHSSTAMPVVESAAWAMLAAVIGGSVFWMSVAVLERLFGLSSDWTLLELCSPEHPLIHDLVLRAPGTYAHSVMVGNLGENAAREISANPVLVRAMATFHDVGKLTRPSYFVENQQGENPHDKLSPKMSARVILSHVSDGIDLARKHRLPTALQDGIAQHHGSGLVQYFFNKAVLEAGDEVNKLELEADFRYPGPKPQTREAAILALADSVEAVSRTIPRGHVEELEIAVAKMIEDRRAEGLLDECELTFRDLYAIQRSFLRTLGALRHERVAYDIEEVPNEAENPQGFDLQQLREAMRHDGDQGRP